MNEYGIRQEHRVVNNSNTINRFMNVSKIRMVERIKKPNQTL